MATLPLRADCALSNLLPIAAILSRFDRLTLETFLTVAIDLLDLQDGNPDEEDNADREASDGDDQDQAWIEWTTMRGAAKRGSNILAGEEDDEEDDPGEDDDPAEDSDNDKAADDEPCDEPWQDLEREQMQDDVPVLHVFTLDHNIFTDQRQSLGYSNLLTSFRCGEAVVSADSGQSFRPKHIDGWRMPAGEPV